MERAARVLEAMLGGRWIDLHPANRVGCRFLRSRGVRRSVMTTAAIITGTMPVMGVHVVRLAICHHSRSALVTARRKDVTRLNA
jgi:hypothetical protein